MALEKSEKNRFSVTLTGLYLDSVEYLIAEGIFLNTGEVFRDSLRRTFRAYGIEPFPDKDHGLKASKIKGKAISFEIKPVEKKVSEDVAPS